MPPHSVIFSALNPQAPLSPFRIQKLYHRGAPPTRTPSRGMLKQEPDSRPLQPGGTTGRPPDEGQLSRKSATLHLHHSHLRQCSPLAAHARGPGAPRCGPSLSKCAPRPPIDRLMGATRPRLFPFPSGVPSIPKQLPAGETSCLGREPLERHRTDRPGRPNPEAAQLTGTGDAFLPLPPHPKPEHPAPHHHPPARTHPCLQEITSLRHRPPAGRLPGIPFFSYLISEAESLAPGPRPGKTRKSPTPGRPHASPPQSPSRPGCRAFPTVRH
jgi:hypothetical protein